MSGPLEMVVVVVASALGLALFVLVMVALGTLIRTLRSARSAIDDLHATAIPLLNDAHEVVLQARTDLGKVDTLLSRADSISGTVDSASKLAYSLFSNPAVKMLAVASGGARALGRLRRGRSGAVGGAAKRRALGRGAAKLESGESTNPQ